MTTKTQRKLRSDAKFTSPAARQAAYRVRLQEKQRTGIEQPLPVDETDTSIAAVEEPSVTACEAPVTEIGPENAQTRHSACYGSSVEGHNISENVPLPVTPETCSEREELQDIEGDVTNFLSPK